MKNLSSSSSRGAGSCSKWLKAEERLGMFWDVEVDDDDDDDDEEEEDVDDDDDDDAAHAVTAETAETAGTICRLLAMTTIYWAKSVQWLPTHTSSNTSVYSSSLRYWHGWMNKQEERVAWARWFLIST